MRGKVGRPRTGLKPNFSIRIPPDALRRAGEAAIASKKTLGLWLEESIVAKIKAERGLDKEDSK